VSVVSIIAFVFLLSAEVPDNNTFVEFSPPPKKQTKINNAKSIQQKPSVKKDSIKKNCSSFLDAVECDVLSKINAIRASKNLTPLVPSQKCTNVAEAHTRYMVGQSNSGLSLQKSLSHYQFTERIKKFGLGGGKASENVAAGTNLLPEAVVAMWMRSSGHKQNIMDPNVKYTGLSAIKDGRGNIFWTQCFSSKD
jgi:uncharacterized protein YkwD